MNNKDGILIYNSFYNNGITPFIGSNNNWIKEITKFQCLDFSHLGPDLIGLAGKNVYGIEHFYVDSSKKNRKGNALKIEKFYKIEKNIIPNIEKDLETQNISSNSYKFKSTLTYQNLKNNIYLNFDEHYKKIDDYNTNIKEKYGNDKSIEIIFFIEFDSLISVYLEKGKFIRYVYPFNDINFLKYFEDKKNIKGLIFYIDNINYYIPIQDKYKIDNKNIFDFNNGNIEDFEMNQITVGTSIKTHNK